ncbi:hypothetical protein BC939DRAFT_167199 [Gamsiella multidivaricata]|uniref:uncharacterized protein n=1 Tax=Gamsiella multidivaricata TaxID=101098 RepID=UPI002220C649|nr:uncharacterized protein BC939DRAFT_167199 [Gamsiella multidivaricata]KAI7823229.1 hypothetical protein BC939DRAFT_167199 [Gamsiella multidivaricata]
MGLNVRGWLGCAMLLIYLPYGLGAICLPSCAVHNSLYCKRAVAMSRGRRDRGVPPNRQSLIVLAIVQLRKESEHEEKLGVSTSCSLDASS